MRKGKKYGPPQQREAEQQESPAAIWQARPDPPGQVKNAEEQEHVDAQDHPLSRSPTEKDFRL